MCELNVLYVQEGDGIEKYDDAVRSPRGTVTWLRIPVAGNGTPKAGVSQTNAFVAGGRRRRVTFQFFADDGYSYQVEAIASEPNPRHNDMIDLHDAVISKTINPTRTP